MQVATCDTREASMFRTDLSLEAIQGRLAELNAVVKRRTTIYCYNPSEVLGQDEYFLMEFEEQIRRNTQVAITGLKEIVFQLEEFRSGIETEATDKEVQTTAIALQRSFEAYARIGEVAPGLGAFCDIHNLLRGRRASEFDQLEAQIGENRITVFQVGRTCRDPLVVVSGDGHEMLVARLEEEMRRAERTGPSES